MHKYLKDRGHLPGCPMSYFSKIYAPVFDIINSDGRLVAIAPRDVYIEMDRMPFG